jgi:hypothetical protein
MGGGAHCKAGERVRIGVRKRSGRWTDIEINVATARSCTSVSAGRAPLSCACEHAVNQLASCAICLWASGSIVRRVAFKAGWRDGGACAATAAVTVTVRIQILICSYTLTKLLLRGLRHVFSISSAECEGLSGTQPQAVSCVIYDTV